MKLQLNLKHIKRELVKVVWKIGRNKEICEGGTVEESYFALKRDLSILKGDDLPGSKGDLGVITLSASRSNSTAE